MKFQPNCSAKELASWKAKRRLRAPCDPDGAKDSTGANGKVDISYVRRNRYPSAGPSSSVKTVRSVLNGLKWRPDREPAAGDDGGPDGADESVPGENEEGQN